MSPVGAQGINIALRDAIIAANELIPALRNGTDLDAAATRIEPLRGPEIDRIQRLAVLGPKIVLGRTPFHEAIRRLIPFVAERARRRSTSGGDCEARRPPILGGSADVMSRDSAFATRTAAPKCQRPISC